MASLKPATPTAADLECGGMVVNIKTGAIGWVIWPETGAVLVEVSFGAGRHEWDVARWPHADVVVPGSCSKPSVAAVPSGSPAVAVRGVTDPAGPADGEGAAGPAGTSGEGRS